MENLHSKKVNMATINTIASNTTSSCQLVRALVLQPVLLLVSCSCCL